MLTVLCCLFVLLCVCAVGENSDVGTTSAAVTVGTIVTTRGLDAEQFSSYNLTLQATDGSNTAYTQVRRLLFRLSVSWEADKRVQAFVSSRLDYCHGFFIETHGKYIQKLHNIDNIAARVRMRSHNPNHITASFTQIIYKIELFT